MTNANLDAGKFENVFLQIKICCKIDQSFMCQNLLNPHTCFFDKRVENKIFVIKKRKGKKGKGFPFAVLRGNYKRERWEANTISGKAQRHHLRTNKGL